jgi:hypothetical protein
MNLKTLIVRVLIGIATVVIGCLLCVVGGLSYQTTCVDPGDQALRLLEPWVKKVVEDTSAVANDDLGRLNDALARVHAGQASEKYDVFAVRVDGAVNVVIAPRHLAICRRSFVLENRATRLIIREPFLHF